MGSGRFRCLSKPFKKWAFAKGVQFTQIFSQQFINKYLLKFLRKHAKAADTNLSIAGRSEHRESIALAVRMTDILLNGQCGKPASGEVAELRRDELRASLRGAIDASLMGQGDCEAQADATKGVEAETLSPLRLIRSSTCLNAQPREEWANELVDFAMGLGEAVDKNVGLDHSKVREYWLQRGPRWLITAIVFFVFTVVCQEMLKSHQKEASNDSFYTLAVNAVAFIIATVMLYFRLPDSIEASISRAAHDFYVDYKRRMGNYKHHEPAILYLPVNTELKQFDGHIYLCQTPSSKTETEPKFSTGLYLGDSPQGKRSMDCESAHGSSATSLRSAPELT